MKFLATLGRFARSPAGIITLVLAACLGALYGWGGRFGVTGQRRLLVVIVLLAVSFLIVMLLSMRSRKNSRQVEQSMVMEADAAVAAAAAEEKRAREAARQELVAAIEALRRTRVAGGLRGDSALYILPWYLVLGVGGAGKSSLIRNSGLQVPGQAPGELKGIGASQNFEWWFTSQAVFLEASQRFVAPDQGVAGDRAWRAGLEQLRKHRPGLPLNGILVTVPATDLLDPVAGALEAKAKLLRRRLEALIKELDLVCPVYLVVTKADLVHGFQEFFGDLRGSTRDQVWGATLTAPLMTSGDPGAVVEQEFQLLAKRLLRRRQPRLVRAEGQETQGKVYLFPLEFASLRKPLQRLANILAEPDPLAPTPLLRGFYFATSGGGGATVDNVLTEVSRVIGLPAWEAATSGRGAGLAPPPPGAAGAGWPGAGAGASAAAGAGAGWAGAAAGPGRGAAASGLPLFLKTFFLQVLIPDQQIAQPTAGAARRRLIWRWVGRGAAFAALALLAVLLLVSFGRNQALVGSTVRLARDARALSLPIGTAANLEARLQELTPLRDRLGQLDRRPPLSLGLGLYQGRKLSAATRGVYLDKLTDVLLRPAHELLERRLGGGQPTTPEEFDRYLDAYAVYRMLGEPKNGDAGLIATELRRLWEGSPQSIEGHVQLAWRYPQELAARAAPLVADPALVQVANRIIKDFYRPEAFLEQLLADVNADQGLADVSLATLPDAREVLRYDRDAAARYGNRPVQVDRAFTREGWKRGVRPALLSPEIGNRYDWLLREAFGSLPSRDLGWLVGEYARRYRDQWSQFLYSVDMARAGDLAQDARAVERLAQPKSAFFALLETARDNLDLGDELAGLPAEAQPELRKLADDFDALHRLYRAAGEGEGGGGKPIDKLREQYAAIAERMAAGMEATGEDPIPATRLLVTRHCNLASGKGQRDCNAVVERYLLRPVQGAGATRSEEGVQALNQAWNEQVWRWFEDRLAGRYPLATSSSDAGIEDFAAFFGPNGVLDTFVRERLGEYVNADGTAKPNCPLGAGMLAALRQARQIRDAVFDRQSGGLRVGFTLRSQQVVTLSGASSGVFRPKFQLGGQVLQVTGPNKTVSFRWPGDEPATDAQVAVEPVGNDPGPKPITEDVSSWSLFRLLDRVSSYQANSDTEYDLAWTLEREGHYRLKVAFTLTATSRYNPFTRGFFRFNLPASLN